MWRGFFGGRWSWAEETETYQTPRRGAPLPKVGRGGFHLDRRRPRAPKEPRGFGGGCGRRETGRDAGLREEPMLWRFLVNPAQSQLSVLLCLGHVNRLFIHTHTSPHITQSRMCRHTPRHRDSHKLTIPPLLKHHALARTFI